MVKRGFFRRAGRWLLVGVGAYFAVVYVGARLDWVVMGEGGAPDAIFGASPEPATPPPAPSTRVAGAIHVHTRRSHDAIGTEAELAGAARAAGLDFVFLADHRDAGAPPAEWERPARRVEGVLLVRGQEIRVEGVGKVLVDRLDTAVVSWTGGVEGLLARVERDSAFAVVAHPRGRSSDRWRPAGAPGMAAWEVFDFADVARRRLASPSVLYHLVALVGGELAGRAEHNWLRLYRDGFRSPGVAAFDSLWVAGGRGPMAAMDPLASAGGRRPGAVERPVDGAVGRPGPGALTSPGAATAERPGPTAVGGLDMHPKARLPGGRLFPSYASSLRTMINHVAVDAPPGPDPVEAARALGAAIRRGDVFVSFGDAEGARGFRVGMVAPGDADLRGAIPAAGESATHVPASGHVPPGGAVRMAAGLRLEAGFATDPGRVAYRVVRDGREVGWWRGPGLSRAVDAPGAYRVEVFRYSARLGGLVWNLRPWIFVNPVLVRPSAGGR
ncbi:MAG: hypothetical protein OXE73_16600 [Gammaproteobacteria bacterium]|nr:hypothetical protein [Gammaproteobacteria bacterium]